MMIAHHGASKRVSPIPMATCNATSSTVHSADHWSRSNSLRTSGCVARICFARSRCGSGLSLCVNAAMGVVRSDHPFTSSAPLARKSGLRHVLTWIRREPINLFKMARLTN